MNAPLKRVASALASLALAAGVALAQEFPSRPVELMVAFPAGGSTDIGARVLAAIAEKQLGQPMVVVNKGGAGGQVGWTGRGAAQAGRLFHRLPQSAGHQHGDPRSRAQGDLRSRRFRADHQPDTRPRLDLGTRRQSLQVAQGSGRGGAQGTEHHPHRHHRHPKRRSLGDPNARGGRAGRHLPHRAPRGQRDAAEGGHGRQHRRRVRQRRRRRSAGTQRRDPCARGARPRALEVPARRADHEGARLSDRRLELDARHRRAERHPGTRGREARRRAQEGDGGSRPRRQDGGGRARGEDHGRGRVRHYYRETHERAKKYVEWARSRGHK